MKITGVSFGRRNGNNDTMCRAALEAAKEKGAEIEFIHIMDWDIRHCTGCNSCTEALMSGKGNLCVLKDEFDEFRSILLDSDGVLFVGPIFESGGSGLLHTICDRFGPRFDRGMNIIGTQMSEKTGGKPVDPRILKDKVISFIGIGGSDWASRVQTDHAMCAMSPAWKVIDNEYFSWSLNIIMDDDKIKRVREIGANLVDAAADYESAVYKGDPGVCPHCHCANIWIKPGTLTAVCELCGLEGTLEIEDGKYVLKYDPSDEPKAHDTISGKFMHCDDINENLQKFGDFKKTEEYKRRVAHYKEVCEVTPPPSKR